MVHMDGMDSPRSSPSPAQHMRLPILPAGRLLLLAASTGRLPHVRQCVVPNDAPATTTTDALSLSMDEHQREMASGLERFPPPMAAAGPSRVFSDSDFVSRDVGIGRAGPDEALLRGGHLLHASAGPLLTPAECDAVVAEADAAMRAGRGSSFTYTAANRLGEVHVSDLPQSREWLRGRLHDTFFPLLQQRFGGTAGDVVAADELAVYDALVIKYDAARGGTRQPMHRDGSLISLNFALSSLDAFVRRRRLPTAS